MSRVLNVDARDPDELLFSHTLHDLSWFLEQGSSALQLSAIAPLQGGLLARRVSGDTRRKVASHSSSPAYRRACMRLCLVFAVPHDPRKPTHGMFRCGIAPTACLARLGGSPLALQVFGSPWKSSMSASAEALNECVPEPENLMSR